MATIRKKRDKWHVQVRRKGCPHLTRTFTLKTDALQWANQTEVQADRGNLPSSSMRTDQITVSDLIIRYRDTVLFSHRGYKNQKYVLNAFLRTDLAAVSLSNLNSNHFASYRDERLKSVKPATCPPSAFVRQVEGFS